jgi:hypothetical protein
MIDLVVVGRSFTTSQFYLIFMAVVTEENKLRTEEENGRILKESYTKGLHIRHACGSDKN